MNIRKSFVIIYLSFTSCNLTQPAPDSAEIQKMFDVASGVKEIHTVSVLVTSEGEKQFTSTTTFAENGAPIETKNL